MAAAFSGLSLAIVSERAISVVGYSAYDMQGHNALDHIIQLRHHMIYCRQSVMVAVCDGRFAAGARCDCGGQLAWGWSRLRQATHTACAF